MNSKSYYERYLNKYAFMNRGSNYCELSFQNSYMDAGYGKNEQHYVKVIEVHDSFVLLDLYYNYGEKGSRLTIPFEQLSVRESSR